MKSTKPFMALVLALASGCGAGTEAQEDAGIATVREELDQSKFSAWELVPSTQNFLWRPAIVSQYTNPQNRITSVCATAGDQLVYCNARTVIGGTDSGWGGNWWPVTAPPGVTFQSGPALASFSANNNDYDVLAARGTHDDTCGVAACVYLRVGQHGGDPNWYMVPSSGNVGGGAVSVISMDGYLYLFASSVTTGSASYTRNYVGSGYSNGNWEAWKLVPGGQQFHKNITVKRFPSPSFSGFVVAGLALDDTPRFQRFRNNRWDGKYYDMAITLKDSPVATSFSNGNDIELFGLGTDNTQYQANIDMVHWTGDGFWQMSDRPFNSSTDAFAPTPGHIDFAAVANTQKIYVSSYQQ